MHGQLYLSGTPTNGGPAFRTTVDSGIHVGAGSDAAAVTGRNSAGELINDGQRLTRMEALRLCTAENGWSTHEEDKLGCIEPGKFGDMVVLSDDYLDPKKVTDEGIKRLKSVLTVVDGKVAYDQMK